MQLAVGTQYSGNVPVEDKELVERGTQHSHRRIPRAQGGRQLSLYERLSRRIFMTTLGNRSDIIKGNSSFTGAKEDSTGEEMLQVFWGSQYCLSSSTGTTTARWKKPEHKKTSAWPQPVWI